MTKKMQKMFDINPEDDNEVNAIRICRKVLSDLREEESYEASRRVAHYLHSIYDEDLL